MCQKKISLLSQLAKNKKTSTVFFIILEVTKLISMLLYRCFEWIVLSLVECVLVSIICPTIMWRVKSTILITRAHDTDNPKYCLLLLQRLVNMFDPVYCHYFHYYTGTVVDYSRHICSNRFSKIQPFPSRVGPWPWRLMRAMAKLIFCHFQNRGFVTSVVSFNLIFFNIFQSNSLLFLFIHCIC